MTFNPRPYGYKSHKKPKSKFVLTKIAFSLFLIFLSIGLLYFIQTRNLFAGNKTTSDEIRVVNDSTAELGKDNFDHYTIQKGDTFGSIMEDLKIKPEEQIVILEVSKSIHDLSSLKTGQPLRLALNENNEMVTLEYEYDDENILLIKKEEGEFIAQNTPIVYDVEIVQAGGEISSSLFQKAAELDIEDGVIMEITEILAWQVDFVASVQSGDSFKVVYEKRFRDGEYVDYGRVLGVVFNNQGEESWAIYFEDSENNKGYYGLDGESTKKAFLKSPLQYKYISSGYTNSRFHPVLKKYLPHQAIDYAASAGTPIAAVGKGKITYAGSNGGEGIFVKIRHNDIYTTQYSHLQGIAKGIKVGSQVEQGDIIGYVGSTGYSTGPHLQYAMSKNGSFVNPTTEDLPSGDPIKPEYLESLKSNIDMISQRFSELESE